MPVEHQLASLGLLEVDAHAAFAQVVPQERRSHRATVGIGHGRQRGPTQFAGQRLHLDDVSAQAGQELRGVRERLHLFDRQHPYALEGPSGRGGGPRGCRNELHSAYYIRIGQIQV